MVAHEFSVGRGRRSLTTEQWRALTLWVTEWFPGARIEIDLEDGEMGPFGVRLANRIRLRLVDGPHSRAAAAVLLRDALAELGRPDLLDPEP